MRKHPVPPVPTSDVPGVEAARAAQRASTARFMDAVSAGPEVRRVSATLKGMRERNGFGELFTKSMRLR